MTPNSNSNDDNPYHFDFQIGVCYQNLIEIGPDTNISVIFLWENNSKNLKSGTWELVPTYLGFQIFRALIWFPGGGGGGARGDP